MATEHWSSESMERLSGSAAERLSGVAALRLSAGVAECCRARAMEQDRDEVAERHAGPDQRQTLSRRSAGAANHTLAER